MKTMIYLAFMLAFLMDGPLSSGQSTGKATLKTEEIKLLVDGKGYVFQVQSVSPRRGGMIQQSPGYKVSIGKDTLISLLPYFGRAYQAGYGSSDASLNFTSLNFEYKTAVRKKGGWNVTVGIKDAKSATQMIFNVYENGTAYLSVNCRDRESISYNGYIEPWKGK